MMFLLTQRIWNLRASMMWVRVQIKNQKHDFCLQLVQQTLSEAFYNLVMAQGTAIRGRWRKVVKGDMNSDIVTQRQAASTHYEE